MLHTPDLPCTNPSPEVTIFGTWSSPCRVFWAGLLLALCGCAAPLATAQSAPAAPASPAPLIDSITLERNCFGCEGGAVLVLRRNGSASQTVTGNARQGTASKMSRGVVRSVDFDGLAQLLTVQGFFELNDIYQDPLLQDGPWSTISVTRGSQEKRVFRRDEAGPPVLKQLEAAIDTVRSKITFAPAI